jgi:hypothetical protein
VAVVSAREVVIMTLSLVGDSIKLPSNPRCPVAGRSGSLKSRARLKSRTPNFND